MIATILLIVLCLFPGVSHILIGRIKQGVAMFFLSAFAFNGLIVMPHLQPQDRGGWWPTASIVVLVGLWGYSVYSLISLSFRAVNPELERQGKADFQNGMVDYLKSDLEQACKRLEDAAQVDADDPDTQFHLAMIYKRKGMGKEAKKAFSRSLDLDPDKWAWEIHQELKDL